MQAKNGPEQLAYLQCKKMAGWGVSTTVYTCRQGILTARTAVEFREAVPTLAPSRGVLLNRAYLYIFLSHHT